jgi:hypothetical protein
MIKSFFISMVDPEYGKSDALGKNIKGLSKQLKGAGQYPMDFTRPSAGIAGSVCGPNGCQ